MNFAVLRRQGRDAPELAWPPFMWLSSGRAPRCLVVLAHPDVETIGLGARIGRLDPIEVIHVTDGAPRDSRFMPAELAGLGRERYTAIRREEVTRALAMAHVPASRLRCLGAVAQEAIEEAPSLARKLVELFARTRPEVVITHPYEGGHPDHDAAALAVHSAAVLARWNGVSAPLIFEAASYNAARGHLVTGEFIPYPGVPEIALRLSDEEASRKRAMLDCFSSQKETLAPFGAEVERFRPAPTYDFRRPPHEGTLHYEHLGFPIDGARWRKLAVKTLTLLGLGRERCL
ncbi:PIG-L deacetylase family protein [Sorangium cellulosum]|uniref:PIG-L deacetylase family protein n=1 Tax=Sorangium cellulosum TaxID=56 RepID=UPI001F325FE8|nr:PIG-L family deacetylase [Sorangium cellulosum]